MRVAVYGGVICLALSGGAVAQERSAYMALYLNGAATDDSITFGFVQGGCSGTSTMTQRYARETRRDVSATFDFGQINPAVNAVGTAEALGIAMLNLSLRDGADPVEVGVTLTSPDAGVRATWAGQGAICTDDSCSIALQQTEVQLVVGGADPASRAEIVLQDIRALAAACATTERG